MPARLWTDNAPNAPDDFGVANDGITRIIITLAGISYVWLDERDGLQVLALEATAVRRSSDGGATFGAASAALPAAGHNASCLRVRATGTLLVGLLNAGAGVQLARSVNDGASWSTVTVDPTVALSSRMYPGTFVECSDGSILCHRDPNAGLHDHVRVYRSTDDGASWSTVLDPIEANAGGQGGLSYIRGIAFLVTGDGAHNLIVHRSTDQGVSWSLVLDAGTRRLFDASFKCRSRIALRPDGTRLYVYTRANPGGERYFSADQGAGWTLEADPFGVQAIHGVWATAQRLWIVRDIAGLTLLRSNDDGATFDNLGGIRGGATNAAGTFAPHQLQAPPGPGAVLLGAWGGRTTLGGRRPQRVGEEEGEEIEREPGPESGDEAPS